MSEEILMKMVIGKNAVEGESSATFDSKDTLLQGFQEGKILELREFTFDISIDDNDSGETPDGEDDDDDADKKKKKKKKKKKEKSKFQRWLGGERDLQRDGYPVELKPFEFTRQLDSASLALFDKAAHSIPFTSVSVVKRKVVGRGTGSEISSHGFLRFDFDDVLLINIKWDIEDELIMETGEFICRKMVVKYRPQLADGSLGDIVPAEYQFPANEK